MYLLVHSKILVEPCFLGGTRIGSGNTEKKDTVYKESYSSGKTDSSISVYFYKSYDLEPPSPPRELREPGDM